MSISFGTVAKFRLEPMSISFGTVAKFRLEPMPISFGTVAKFRLEQVSISFGTVAIFRLEPVSISFGTSVDFYGICSINSGVDFDGHTSGLLFYTFSVILPFRFISIVSIALHSLRHFY